MASILCMPFLRPLLLPRLSSLNLLQRRISSLPLLRQEGINLPKLTPHVHLLTVEHRQLAQLKQRREPRCGPLL